MSNNNTNQPNTNEIDIAKIFILIGDRIKSFFSGLFKIISKILVAILFFTLRNMVATIIITLFSIGILIYQIKSSPEVYESNMKMKTVAISNQDAISYVNRLTSLTEKENKDILASTLGLDKNTASKISLIEAYWLIDTDGDGISNYTDFENEYYKAPDDSISHQLTLRLLSK